MSRRQWEAAIKIGGGIAVVWLVIITYWLYTMFHDITVLTRFYG